MFKIKLEQKERVSKREELIITLTAIGIAFVLSGIFIALNGVNPFVALWKVITSALGSPYGISETLVKAIPLIFTGLAVGIALNSKLWNIGAEGQLILGAICGGGMALAFYEQQGFYILPLVLLFTPGLSRSRGVIILASLMVVVGGWMTIYVIVIGGQAFPMALFPGKTIIESGFYDGVNGMASSYTPSIPEVLLGLGGVSLRIGTICFLRRCIAKGEHTDNHGQAQFQSNSTILVHVKKCHVKKILKNGSPAMLTKGA